MATRSYRWKDWLAVLEKRNARAQHVENDGIVFVWFYDVDRYETMLWRGSVPYGVVESGYSQAENDTDLAEFDSMSSDLNQAISQLNRDGRAVIQPVTVGSGLWHNWHGEGDNVGGGLIRGGAGFQTERASAGDETVVWEYRDPVWMAGGLIHFAGAEMGDYIRFNLFAPATNITPNGSNEGNCNLVSGIIVPAAGDGAYDVDLATAIPVPTADREPYTGYWDYTMPADMKNRGTITPGVPGQAKYHLVPARVELTCFIGNSRILGEGERVYQPQNINVSLCLPGWQFECILHNENGTHTVKAVWEVLLTRYWTN